VNISHQLSSSTHWIPRTIQEPHIEGFLLIAVSVFQIIRKLSRSKSPIITLRGSLTARLESFHEDKEGKTFSIIAAPSVHSRGVV
jgi:hypothetical protein